MRHSLCSAVIFILVILQTMLEADNRQEPDTLLTLSETVDYAVKHSIAMLQEVNRQKSSYLELLSSRESLTPTARGGLSTTGRRSVGSSTTFISAGASIGSEYELSPSKFSYYSAAKARNTAAQYDLNQRRRDVAAETIVRYIEAVAAEKQVEARQQNVDYQKRKLEQIEALFRQGIKARSDVLQQRSALFEAQSRLLDAVQSVKRKKLDLLDVSGLPVGGHDYLLDTTAVAALFLMLAADTVGSTPFFPKKTDGIVACSIRVDAAEAALRGAKYGYVPSLFLSAGWTTSAQGGVLQGIDIGNGESSLQIGASITVPLLDRKQRRLAVLNAELALQSGKLELERMRRDFFLAVERSALDDELALEKMLSAEAGFDAAKDAFEAVEERYAVGASNIVELNAARTSYIEALSALIQARFDRIISRIVLMHEVGRIDEVTAFIAGV